MQAPAGWSEPFQTPEFNEYTVVLEGDLTVEYDGGAVTLTSGQAIVTESGERVRYSTRDGAYYVAICVPAFAPETVRRDRD
jgi:ethanolamine utilization protein EutQ (cupin superfamily)